MYPLKMKDQVLQTFKEFHASVEWETRRKLKCLRSKNGGEYRGPFKAFYKAHGIQHEKVPPKTPQDILGEVVKTAVDLINLSPSRPLN